MDGCSLLAYPRPNTSNAASDCPVQVLQHLQNLTRHGAAHDGVVHEVGQEEIKSQQDDGYQKQRTDHARHATVCGVLLARSGAFLSTPKSDVKQHDNEHRGEQNQNCDDDSPVLLQQVVSQRGKAVSHQRQQAKTQEKGQCERQADYPRSFGAKSATPTAIKGPSEVAGNQYVEGGQLRLVGGRLLANCYGSGIRHGVQG